MQDRNTNFEFSLIMGTLGRSREIGLFIDALLRQKEGISWELIIVDQNDDERVSSVLAGVGPVPDQCSIRHITTEKKGLSHARNLGLSVATGKIIAFPDDDCIYSREVLQFIFENFGEGGSGSRDVITLYDVSDIDALETRSAKRPTVRRINGFTIFRRAISYTIFVRNRFPMVRFDEAFGLGARYGAAEETDYLFRLHLGGAAMRQMSGPVIFHPDKKRDLGNIERAYGYSVGTGAFFRKHFSLRSPLLLLFLLLSTARLMVKVLEVSLRRKGNEAMWFKSMLKGRIAGFVEYYR
jgi:glycosyltransferase involved in cell wall biosynthesis